MTPPRAFDTSHFIKEKQEVDNPDTSITFKPGDGAKRQPARFVPGDSNIFILGLAGSGRRELAVHLAQRTGGSAIHLEASGDAEADAVALDALCTGKGVVAAVDSELLTPQAGAALKAHGLVFYLIADVGLALRAMGGGDATRERLAAELIRCEPIFMSALHFIVRADQPPEAMAQDAALSLGLR
ncbi:MAG: hypothetical protein AB7E47_14280 [Desulfovibrionaceae bacterium]